MVPPIIVNKNVNIKQSNPYKIDGISLSINSLINMSINK